MDVRELNLELHMRRKSSTRVLHSEKYRSQRGMTLVELMIACVILLVGMVGVAVLFSTAATSTSRTKLDTGGTLVAKMVIEQISAQDPGTASDVTLQDCAGTTWTMHTTAGGAALVTTAGAVNYGAIDFTQASVPSGYSMQYKDCGDIANTGRQTTYDVRWNVTNVSLGYTRMITVSARQKGNSNTGSYFSIPVTLRTVAGPTQQ
jgi:prepilin-type N-terminal cleavage/methylation domain-containing protein